MTDEPPVELELPAGEDELGDDDPVGLLGWVVVVDGLLGWVVVVVPETGGDVDFVRKPGRPLLDRVEFEMEFDRFAVKVAELELLLCSGFACREPWVLRVERCFACGFVCVFFVCVFFVCVFFVCVFFVCVCFVCARGTPVVGAAEAPPSTASNRSEAATNNAATHPWTRFRLPENEPENIGSPVLCLGCFEGIQESTARVARITTKW